MAPVRPVFSLRFVRGCRIKQEGSRWTSRLHRRKRKTNSSSVSTTWWIRGTVLQVSTNHRCGGYPRLQRLFLFTLEVPRPVWRVWSLCDKLSPPECWMTSCQRDGSPSVTASKEASKKVRQISHLREVTHKPSGKIVWSDRTFENFLHSQAAGRSRRPPPLSSPCCVSSWGAETRQRRVSRCSGPFSPRFSSTTAPAWQPARAWVHAMFSRLRTFTRLLPSWFPSSVFISAPEPWGCAVTCLLLRTERWARLAVTTQS